MKLLIDENLSPEVARALRDDGLDVAHVRDRGLLGAGDHEVFLRAFDEDRVLVSCNVDDFEAIARNVDLHCGLILIDQAYNSRALQLQIVRQVLGHLGDADMMNRLVRVDDEGAISG